MFPKRLRSFVALVLLLVVLGVVAYFLVRAITTARSFPLPSVIGEQAAKATTQLEAKGLVVSRQTVRNAQAAGVLGNRCGGGGGDRVNNLMGTTAGSAQYPKRGCRQHNNKN